MINKWRKQNGLDYDGWWQYLLKRWLRRSGLGFLVPFDYYQDDYDDSIQTLIVLRWGTSTVERYEWPYHRDVELLSRLRSNGMINKRQLYKVIQAEARRLRHTRDLVR